MSYPQSTSPPHWESRNGYVPPPRFQQLRAQDNLLLSQFNQNHADQGQRQFPFSANPLLAVQNNNLSPQGQTPSPNQSPQMTHARTTSFFSFSRNKQTTDTQNTGVQIQPQAGNTNGNTAPSQQQYLPPTPNSFSQESVPSSARQGPGQPFGAPQNPPPQHVQQTSISLPQQQLNPSVPQNSPSRPPQQNPQSQPPPGAGPEMTSGTSQSTLTRSGSSGKAQPPASSPLHPEIRSVVQLSIAQAHKVYVSGPLIRKYDRQPDGQKPHKDEGWVDVWAQLGGTTLSVWSMKEIQEASKQGKEVPPSYINVTDAFIQVLGSVTLGNSPMAPSQKYTNVIALNTAGSNLLLFACPSTAALISWASALRLAAWEKSRLEEIYTAHLIRITLTARDVPTTLIRGKMEGYARVRLAGQTDWKRVWLVVQEGTEGIETGSPTIASAAAQVTMKKKRMSNLFSRDSNVNFPVPTRATISMYAGPKPKDRKKPLLTIHTVTQAFGVYPERPELINRSTLIKIEGVFGDDDMAGTMRTREGWVLIMPELENGVGQAAEMLKWVVALHDAFELYGRPEAWTWDPRDPLSLMFGYPVGPQKENLFLDREIVENMDPRDDRTSAIRSEMKRLLLVNMKPAVQAVQARPPNQQFASSTPPSLPPIDSSAPLDQDSRDNTAAQHNRETSSNNSTPLQLPPLNLDSSISTPSHTGPLTPITERTLSADLPPISSTDPRSGPSPLNEQTQRQNTSSSGFDNPRTATSAPQHTALISGPISSSPPTSTFTTSANLPPNTDDNQSTVGSRPLTSTGSRPSSKSVDDRNTAASPSVDFGSPRLLQDKSPAASTSPGTNSPPFNSPTLAQSQPLFLNQRSDTNQSGRSLGGGLVAELSSDVDQIRNSANGNTAHWGQPTPSSSQIQPPTSNTMRASPANEPNDFFSEAALYYIQQNDSRNGLSQQQSRKQPDFNDADDETSSNNESDVPLDKSKGINSFSPPAINNLGRSNLDNRPVPSRRGTPMAFMDNNTNSSSPPPTNTTQPLLVGRLSPTRSGLGRKPSGARAQSSSRSFGNRGAGSVSSHTVNETDEDMSHNKPAAEASDLAYDDPTGEALAALTYLDIADQEATASSNSNRQPSQTVEPLKIRSAERDPVTSPLLSQAPSTGGTVPYRSSFAPSSKAAERKLKAQAQQAAHHAATHKPGRANGRKKGKAVGAWDSSEDEEEDDEEDDEDDIESDSDRRLVRGQQNGSLQQGLPSTTSPKPLHTQHVQDYQQESGPSPSHLRPPRNLPEIPGNRTSAESFHQPQPQPVPRRMVSDQYSTESGRRTMFEDGTQVRSQAEYPQPGAARQNVWSQVLDSGRSGRVPLPEQPPVRDTFVQLDPSETMTKAFTPQGLLSAGLQDKEDRSARRQEELARESGASLINVPNKPPPPQTGLLGAITAHERERKRDGGVGAALTEREREKRLAEERQRRFDEAQRQQLDQMQQGGSMYGGFGFNPMMGNPMMMGMNPMMAMNPMMSGNGMMPGGGMPGMNPMMGYPGMMGGFNPQHMFAAQQAAQAYQQAMMAFSVAGSQIGGEGGGTGGGAGATGAASQLNPNMTGMSGMNPAMTGSGIPAFDPRMSMMGMPMMGMGMGMGMGAPSVGPLGMQATGMSTFDPRSSPGLQNPAQQNTNDAGLFPPNQATSRTSSPASRGSPLARGAPETADRGRPSRPTSPK